MNLCLSVGTFVFDNRRVWLVGVGGRRVVTDHNGGWVLPGGRQLPHLLLGIAVQVDAVHEDVEDYDRAGANQEGRH